MKNKEKTEIQKKLESYQDLKYRTFSLKLLPKDTPMIGVRLPILRKMAKSLTLEELSDNTFEEVMLQGFIIGQIEDVPQFQQTCLIFLPKIKNWSVCDSFISSIQIAKRNPEKLLPFLEKLTSSPAEYTRRFVLVMLLRYYLHPAYYSKIEEILKKTSKDGYYVKMAIAWLLAELYSVEEHLTIAILSSSDYNLDRFIVSKTIAKIKESQKITKEQKQIVTDFQKQWEEIEKEREL